MSIPKRYLSGLSPEERKKRIDEIKRGRKTATSDKSAYSSSRFKTDKGKKTKTSKYTQRGRKLLANSDAKTLDAKLRVLARKTGYSEATLRKVYNRGLAAWRTGHRPGASQHAWGMARVYSFVTGGKTSKTADKDLASRKMKEAVAFRRGLSLAKSIGRATQKASGAASFDVVQRGGKSVRIKRDLGGAGGGQFVSYKVAQAEDLKKSFVVNRRVARMRGKPTSTQQYTVADRPEPSTAPSPQQVLDQLKDALKQDSVPLQDEPLWKRTSDLGGGPRFFSYDDDEEWDDDDIVKQGIDRIQQIYDESRGPQGVPSNARRSEEEIKKDVEKRNAASAKISAVIDYTLNSYETINTDESKLSSGRISEASKAHTQFKEAFDAAAIDVPFAHSLFRGGGTGWTDAVLGVEQGFPIDSLDDLRELIGRTFRTDSWTSTSRASWVAGNSNFASTRTLRDMPNGEAFKARFIFRLHRKSGSRAAFVERASGSGVDEHEVILPPQEHYAVRGISIAASHPALEGPEGYGYDFKAKYGIPDEYDDLWSYDDSIELEDPKDIADGGGSRGIIPLIVIEVEEI